MAADNAPVWQAVTVAEVRDVADRIRRIVLRYETPQVARAGAHVDVEIASGEGTLTRSYSVVDASDDGRDLALSVHLSATSRGGSAAMHVLAPGMTLRATQPLQNFPLGVGAARYVLVAGGVGITALAGTARTLAARRADYELVYVGRSRSAMAYLAELGEAHGDRLSAHVDDEGSPLDVDALLDGIVADPRAASTELYLCGPIRLMDAVRRGWETRGLPPTNLRFETFGNSGAWAPQDFVVRIPRLGVETRVDANSTMLEALENAGVEMMFDCRKGECGICQVAVLDVDGHVDHRDVFFAPDEKARSASLCPCVSRVVTADTPRVGDAPTAVVSAANGPAVVTIEVT